MKTTFLAALSLAPLLLPHPACALSLSLGDLVITEIMSNPDGVSDSQGEWFELYNAGLAPIELHGLSVRDESTSVGTLDFGGSFLLAPGSFASAARSAAAGFVPDGLYDSISLNNAGDTLSIVDGVTTLATLIYGAGEGFAGSSTAIDLGSLLWFADTENLYSADNSGTPGLANVIGAAAGMPFEVIGGPNPVPLPAGVWLLLSGIGMLVAKRR